jgi:hypothetical protein
MGLPLPSLGLAGSGRSSLGRVAAAPTFRARLPSEDSLAREKGLQTRAFASLPSSYLTRTEVLTGDLDSPGVSNERKRSEIHMRQRIVITLGIAVVALVAATAALAGTLTATATVSGTAGISLNLPSNPSITDTLDGTDQTVSYAPVLGVVDARGSGAGWNLQISATTFSDGAGHTLAAGQVGSIAAACHAGSTCTAATSSGITYPLTVGGTAAKFFNAAVNTGLGKIDVTPTINVSIPGNAYAGTYTSTVTLAAATGP